MEVIIRDTCKDASTLVARLIVDSLKVNPRSVLGLATGRTMEVLYQKLVEHYEAKDVDFSKVTTFNLDEYIGLGPNDPDSYRQYMDRHLFNKVNVEKRRTHLPNGIALDIDAECRSYEERIEQAGGIDLQILGLGRHGHIGFNEALSALLSRTRAKALAPITIEQNQSLFKDPNKIPRRAITMGVGTILESRRCVLLVTGSEKAEILAKAVEGPITAMVSATALQLHPRCTVVCDENAGQYLTGKEYYRRTFESEPEWAAYR